MSESEKTKNSQAGPEAGNRAAYDKYETMVRTAMDGFWLLDANGRFLDVNDAYCQMTGYTLEELRDMHIADVEAKEGREDVLRHMRKVIERGSDRFETRHRRKDGGIIDLEVSANYLDSGGGQFFVFLRDITELKKNDAMLRVLSNVVEQSPAAVLITDAGGKIEYANPRFSEISGYSPAELIGRTPAILRSGVHPDQFYGDMWQTISSGMTWRGDICNRKKDGGLYWELRSISPIKDSAGEITHYVSVQVEDTERKRAEEALRESEQRYRMLHLTAFDGMVIADSAGKITECSVSAEKMFGYGPGEMRGLGLVALMPEDIRSRHSEGFESFIRTGEKRAHNIIIETEALKKTGEPFPIELIINSVCVNGRLLIAGTVRDISERKRTREKLSKSEERLAEAQRIARLGNWEWNITANELWWSDEIYRIFGLEPQEFGATYEAFLATVHHEDRDCVRKAVDEALYSRTPYKIQHRIVLPAGDIRFVQERAEVAFDENGRPVRMMGTVQDVTECKLMEDEIFKAQKLESLGVLAGGIAHDFNNLLTGIVGSVFLIRKAASSDRALLDRLGSIDNAINRAKGLTQKLLTFSSGGAPVKQRIDLARMAGETAKLVFAGPRVRFDIDVQNGLWPVEADQGQIDQVFQNIFMNARQAMPDGGKVSIRLENSDNSEHPPLPCGCVRITIADNGAGIPNEHIAKVFDPFFTTRPGGSGLGLSICFSIIKKHSGHIKVASGANGTAFSIYLPALKAPSTTEKENGASHRGAPGVRPRVLVMDDEEMVRKVAGELLVELGYEVVLSSDGEEALSLYRQSLEANRPIDLLVMDLTVQGGMGGKEAIGPLLSMDPGAKAIVSSGYCNSPVMSDYRRYGFKGVLQKPYNLVEFSSILKKVLGEP